jgi:hypothetical protein
VTVRRGMCAGVAVTFAALALALPASAGIEDIFENGYEGKVERDPATYLGFDVVKENGKKKVTKVTARLGYNCTSGGSGYGSARAAGRLKVKGGSFAGKVRVPSEDIPVRAAGARRGSELAMTYDIRGDLLRGGRARGRIDAEIRFGAARGDAADRCYSGRVDWRAERGAEGDPEPPGP